MLASIDLVLTLIYLLSLHTLSFKQASIKFSDLGSICVIDKQFMCCKLVLILAIGLRKRLYDLCNFKVVLPKRINTILFGIDSVVLKGKRD